MSDPKRLFDELGRGELKDLLAAGKSETPDEHQIAALAAKLGILGGLGGAGAAGAGGAGGAAGAGGAGAGAKASAIATAAKGGLAIKVVGVVAVAGAVGGGTVAVATRAAREEPTPAGIVEAPSATTRARVAEPAASLPPRVDPLSLPSAEPSARATPTTALAKSAPPPRPEDEVRLLERAQDALKTRPAEALALCDEHARAHPSGMLAQEREVIAIEALVKTGRMAEARARAAKFRARWPGSSHTRRIETLVGP